ncbi:YehS family protein [Psychroflexus aestuariivivens]|uniref:DUF1456 family protein n=1 Tax=Psychroflexus aestuariivivens TaxID=1795040 RepID=UPI001F023E39|nr:DUF1456 family protein [Psychroflexus aestuariivivens]
MMTTNDVLRRLRFILDYSDSQMINIFSLSEKTVSRAEVSAWMKQEEDDDFKVLEDRDLAIFLNGLIIEKRGLRDGKAPEPEKYLNNNDVLKKLKIAFQLKTDDIIEIYKSAGKKLSPHELSAFLRKPTQPQYRELMDQYLRNFLSGLQVKKKS